MKCRVCGHSDDFSARMEGNTLITPKGSYSFGRRQAVLVRVLLNAERPIGRVKLEELGGFKFWSESALNSLLAATRLNLSMVGLGIVTIFDGSYCWAICRKS